MAAVDEMTGEVSAPEHRSLGEVRNKSYRSFAPDDVLFAKITPCMENGKSAVVPSGSGDLGFGSTEFHVLRANDGANPRFIWHFLRQEYFRRLAEEHMSGSVGQLRVPADFLRDYPISLPPKPIQDEIVRMLDAGIVSGRRANEHTAAGRRATKRFRQAVLAAACSGRLTADWRDRHGGKASAHDLVDLIEQGRSGRYARYKASTTQLPESHLPETWCWTTVGALLDIATGATPLRSRSDYYGGSIPWVTSGAVNGEVVTHATENITDLAIRETNAKVFPAGTLLVAMYGEGQTRGRVGELGIAAATNQAVAALLFDETTKFLRPYLKIFFLENYERIRTLSYGGVQPNLSLGAIRGTALPLPPEDEQREIARRVDTLLKVADDLDARINAAARLIHHSTQAALAKAFRGEMAIPDES